MIPTENSFSTNIKIKYGQLAKVIEWCQNNAKRDWSYDVVESAGSMIGEYDFFFTDEDDYINFLLWQQ